MQTMLGVLCVEKECVHKNMLKGPNTAMKETELVYKGKRNNDESKRNNSRPGGTSDIQKVITTMRIKEVYKGVIGIHLNIRMYVSILSGECINIRYFIPIGLVRISTVETGKFSILLKKYLPQI